MHRSESSNQFAEHAQQMRNRLALSTAVRDNDTKSVQEILTYVKPEYIAVPFGIAAKEGHKHMIDILLPHTPQSDINAALMQAFDGGHIDIVQQLSSWADPNSVQWALTLEESATTNNKEVFAILYPSTEQDVIDKIIRLSEDDCMKQSIADYEKTLISEQVSTNNSRPQKRM